MAPEKKEMPVVIYTAQHRIEGTLVLIKGEHLNDRLNIGDRQFESIQDARVLTAEGDVVHEAESVAVNKAHITLMLPNE